MTSTKLNLEHAKAFQIYRWLQGKFLMYTVTRKWVYMLNYMVVYTEKIVNISQVMQYRVEILVDK